MHKEIKRITLTVDQVHPETVLFIILSRRYDQLLKSTR